MPRPRSRYPTELELQILNLLWDRKPQPVRAIRKLLAEESSRDLAHTSVVTTLNKMVDKGYLRREQEGNAYLFETDVPRESISRGFVDDVLTRVFGGSAKSMILCLLDSEEITPEEQKEIEKLLKKGRQENK